MDSQEQHGANYTVISQGGTVAARFVNGVWVGQGTMNPGEVGVRPGQVGGGQRGGNRTDWKGKCQNYEVVLSQMPQLFEQHKVFIEDPLLRRIAELEQEVQRYSQKTVEQRGLLEDSVREIRTLEKANKEALVYWERESLKFQENHLEQAEELESLRDQLDQINQSGPLLDARPQTQDASTVGAPRVEVNVVFQANGEGQLLDRVVVPEVEQAEVGLPQDEVRPAPVTQGGRLKKKASKRTKVAIKPRCPWKGCKKELANMDSLRQHKYFVHDKKPRHPCTRLGCPQEFSRTSHREDHWRSVHGAPKLPCRACERMFSAVSKLNSHQREVHDL